MGMNVPPDRFPLPDGSYGLIEPIPGVQGAIISREIDGHMVWGQVFGHATRAAEIIERVRADMVTHPERFLSAWHRGVDDKWAAHDCPVRRRPQFGGMEGNG
jgi:hypothetical protein